MTNTLYPHEYVLDFIKNSWVLILVIIITGVLSFFAWKFAVWQIDTQYDVGVKYS